MLARLIQDPSQLPMRNFPCKGSFFLLLLPRGRLAVARLGVGRLPLGQCQVPLGFLTLKPDSSGLLLLPGACAVVEQNWDEFWTSF